MAKKLDGVIEAVRYKNGQIEVVRAFERRGATFSDRIMVTRKELLERLKNGQKFVIGKRREFLASTFDVQKKASLALFSVSRESLNMDSTGPVNWMRRKRSSLSLTASWKKAIP